MAYDSDEIKERYDELDEDERSQLQNFWSKITHYLEDTDNDWVTPGDIKDEIGKHNKGFSDAYDGFLKLFDPAVSAGDAFAFYEMDYEDIEKAGEELGLADDTRRQENQVEHEDPLDGLLQEDHEVLEEE